MTIPDSVVEAACRAWWDTCYGGNQSWESMKTVGYADSYRRYMTAALIDSGRFVDCMTIGYCQEETAKLAESLIKQGKIEICDGLYRITTKKGKP